MPFLMASPIAPCTAVGKRNGPVKLNLTLRDRGLVGHPRTIEGREQNGNSEGSADGRMGFWAVSHEGLDLTRSFDDRNGPPEGEGVAQDGTQGFL
jgi:hypothetical protein